MPHLAATPGTATVAVHRTHHHTYRTSAFQVTFWWMTGLTALALIPAMFLPKTRP